MTRRSGRGFIRSVLLLTSAACGGDPAPGGTVQIDTLASGQVVVTNGVEGLWAEGEAWQVVENLRIGSLDAEGPENFGRITSMDVDAAGRIWVVEGQASEVRVFGPDGAHVRTVGRAGEGPGEFAQPARIDVSPDGEVWVMDPQNARLTVFDSAGRLQSTRPHGGGFAVFPWRGGFDAQGRYWSTTATFEPEFEVRLARVDDDLEVVETVVPPEDPVERLRWTITDDQGRPRVMASVPFQGRLIWERAPSGTVWAFLTDENRAFELSAAGDTLRSMTRPWQSIAVSRAEMDDAIESMSWFTDQGGRIDPSMIPSEKPAISWFFIDDREHLWVGRTAERGSGSTMFDIFDAEARFLGTVTLPFPLQASPSPIVRDGTLHGVTHDEFDVQYLVRASIVSP